MPSSLRKGVEMLLLLPPKERRSSTCSPVVRSPGLDAWKRSPRNSFALSPWKALHTDGQLKQGNQRSMPKVAQPSASLHHAKCRHTAAVGAQNVVLSLHASHVAPTNVMAGPVHHGRPWVYQRIRDALGIQRKTKGVLSGFT